MENLLQVGIISSTHGVRGEVKVYPTTDDIKRFSILKEVEMEEGTQKRTLHIEHVKYFKQFAILKFKEYASLNDVESIKGKTLFVKRDNAVKLEKDEYFIADLIGMKVEDEEQKLSGEIVDVMKTGANDVYEIKLTDGRDLMLPAIRDCILNVNAKEGMMKIHVLEGLL